MKFLSTMEVAEKWGLTTSRVLKLAKGGRIPGAKRIDYRWMIPGNAEKPADARTRAGKALQEPDTFRYPSFEFRPSSSFNPPLNAEELVLKWATEAFYACRFSSADKLLGDLPECAENRYIRIAALYTGCMVDMLQCNPARFFARYDRLTAELEEDFPHKAEMGEYLHLIDATLGNDHYYVHEFRLKSDYAYHESFLPRLANLCTVSLSFAEEQISASALRPYELNCMLLEESAAYPDLVEVHLYLGIAFGELGDTQKQKYHIRKALTLAEKYEVYYPAAYHYYYVRKLFKPVLPEFSEEFRNRLQRLSAMLRRKYCRFMDAISMSSIYELLPHSGYIFLHYAVQGLTNKEIADRLHVSVGTVSNRFREIYSLLGVENKAGLVDLYQKSVGIVVQGSNTWRGRK